MSSPSFSKNKSRGFSLVEMLTVIAIMIIMTGIALGNLPKFRSKIALDLIAQEVAIIARQAQVYGSATKTFGTNTFPSFGVFFDISQPDNFVLFADVTENRRYDPGPGCVTGAVECSEQFFFREGVKVAEVALCPAGGGSCLPAPTALNIVFIRPDFDAKFFDDSSSSLSGDYARITIEKNGDRRYINIWSTGHIYVSRQ